MPLLFVTAAALALPLISDEIPLVDFKGIDSPTSHKWVAMNDPVMGGQSYSTVIVENQVLNFTGKCAIVPSLSAPGFITAVNSDKKPFADVSSCEGLRITAQSFNDYSGFRLSFGNAHPISGKFFAYGYKADFQPTVGSVGSVSVPFHNFTDYWDDATGDPIRTCQEYPKYCPDPNTLQDMKTMSIWAEGKEGDVHLEVTSINGYGCSAKIVES